MKTILQSDNLLTIIISFLPILLINVNAQLQGGWEILNDELAGANSIDFINEQVGWAANGGRIFKTEDGGENWDLLSDLRNEERWVYECIEFVNDSVGWLKRGTEVIFRTDDGGLTWTEKYQVHDGEGLLHMVVINEDVFFAVGWDDMAIERGRVIKSTDGGEHWTVLSTGLDDTFGYAWFINEQIGLISGDGKILKTLDGGNSWDILEFTDFSGIRDFKFADDTTIYFIAHNDSLHYICETTDTLKSWEIKSVSAYPIDSYYLHNDSIFGFSFPWENGSSRNLMKSTDGAITWEIKGRVWDAYCIYILNERELFLFGDYTLYRSKDGGDTWILQYLSYRLSNVFFINKYIGFAGGGAPGRYHEGGGGCMVGEGELFITFNGGSNWIPQSTTSWVRSCFFIDEHNGYYLNWCGAISKTSDGGLTWEGIDSVYIDVSDIYFQNVQEGFVIGSFDDLPAILRTYNGGETWEELWSNQNAGSFNKMFHIENVYWFVGENGLIVNSVGLDLDSFDVNIETTDLPLIDVFFSNQDIGWISGGYANDQGFQSKLFRTNDGGEIWIENTFDTYLIKEMYFKDNFYGWAIGQDTTGAGNFILQTSDGGLSWAPIIGGLSAPLNAIYFKEDVGWAVGENGLVLRTDNFVTWTNPNTGEVYPSNSKLYQNYPNPFNPLTKIEFTLPKAEMVKLEVYNTLGQRIETLLNSKMKSGSHSVEFNAANLPSGIYFYRLQAGEYTEVMKMVLLK